jgi:transposase
LATLPDLNALDSAQLRALVVEKHTEIHSHKIEIENLKLLILKLQRMQFGRSSEKLTRQIEQLELRLEELETSRASQPTPASTEQSSGAAQKPVRGPLPAHLPRETETLQPKETTCTNCGGTLGLLGEDVSEMLEYVPGHFKVIRIARPKLACKRCDRIVQEPAPHRPIDRGLAGPGLLAHVLVAKYSDHLPLYRQSQIYEREGIDLDRSTLSGWVGGASHTLQPLVDALQRYVLDAHKLHGDDVPCGLMCATIGPRAARSRPRFGSLTRPTAKANTRPTIWRSFAESYRPMGTPDSIGSTRKARLSKRRVSRT